MIWRIKMKFQNRKPTIFVYASLVFSVAFAFFLGSGMIAAQQSKPATGPVVPPKAFATPEEAADALIAAAAKYDVAALEQILGSECKDLVFTDTPAEDKDVVRTFAEMAQEKKEIAISPKNKNLAILNIGKDDWPFAIPLIKKQGKWVWDAPAGKEELLYRRIGGNELDAIEVCRGYVDAQEEYATQKHDGSAVNQYAQRIISTPGKQDGLAWQNADGTWAGPIGENAAKAIADGFSKSDPYNGYYFKILKGQGPAAPLGKMDYVVEGAMIGGFALAAAPAEYSVTGVKTFIVSNDGVVYEKDFGEKHWKNLRRWNSSIRICPGHPFRWTLNRRHYYQDLFSVIHFA
jgi:hypothetical protein